MSLLLRGAAPGRVSGSDGSCRDGYLFDFGELKRVMRGLCAELNERFLLPTANPFVRHTVSASGQVDVAVGCDGSRFSFPAGDVVCVPLSNVSVEELAGLFARRFVRAVGGVQRLAERRVTRVTLAVAENSGQEARFTLVVDATAAAAVAAAAAAAAVAPDDAGAAVSSGATAPGSAEANEGAADLR